MIRLDHKVIVVTGAGRGIGRAYAELLAARGASVVVCDLGVDITGSGSDEGLAHEVADAIKTSGGRATACTADITTADGQRAILQAALDLGGRVDGLVNNAGIVADEAFGELTPAALQRQLDVHVFGTVFLTQTLWPELVRSGGAVVNTTSSGIFGAPVQLTYTAAKGAVLSFTRGLAAVGAADGVRVNAIMPGAETRMQSFARVQFGGSAEPSAEAAARSAPSQVSPTLAYLMSDECRISGEVIYSGHGHVRRIAMATGDGIHSDSLTPEFIAENAEQMTRIEPLHIIGDLPSFRDALSAPMTESAHGSGR
jgi:NAD(P)-dependent dehydrogenase (short-subunit alcohol dehydrogenase family)